MQVESKRSFTHGFVLTEPELRRLIETITDQFAKLPGPPGFSATYQLKYRNGAIADTHSLDEVLAQENTGSSQIIRFSTSFSTTACTETSTLFIEFINADLDEEPGYTSVRFTVRGNSRDWVFVTSTLLEERVTKIRRFSLNQLGAKGSATPYFRTLVPVLIATLLLGVTFLVTLQYAVSERSPRVSPATELGEARKRGQIADPIDALMFLEVRRYDRERAQLERLSWPSFLYPLSVIVGGMLVLLAIGSFLARYYLAYNFCWGDYTELFTKRESVRRYVLVVLITGLVVSFVGGILANRWRW